MAHNTLMIRMSLVSEDEPGTAARAPQADRSGLVESSRVEDAGAPDVHDALVYGETAGGFLAQYAVALRRGFVWTAAPERRHDPDLDVEVLRVVGYLDPDRALGESHDWEDEGEMDLSGDRIPYVVLRTVARSAEELLADLQKAYADGLIPLTVPVLEAQDGNPQDLALTMEFLWLDPHWDWFHRF